MSVWVVCEIQTWGPGEYDDDNFDIIGVFLTKDEAIFCAENETKNHRDNNRKFKWENSTGCIHEWHFERPDDVRYKLVLVERKIGDSKRIRLT